MPPSWEATPAAPCGFPGWLVATGGCQDPGCPSRPRHPAPCPSPGIFVWCELRLCSPCLSFPFAAPRGRMEGTPEHPGAGGAEGSPCHPWHQPGWGFWGTFWGAVVGTSPILLLGGCLLGGCVTARGHRDTGWGRVCEGTRSWEVTARHGTRLVRKAERKAKRGWGQGWGQAELSPLPGVATAAPSRRRGGPGARLPALCPAFLALFSFFSPPPPPRDALSNLSIYGQEVRSTGRLRGHPGRGTRGVTHLGDAATPRWGGHSGAGWGHLGMAPPDPRHLSKGL